MKEEARAVLLEIQKQLGNHSSKEDIAAWLVTNVINRDFEFIQRVSKATGTDPSRVDKILIIYGFFTQNNFKFMIDTVKEDIDSVAEHIDQKFLHIFSQDGGMGRFTYGEKKIMFIVAAVQLFRLFVFYIRKKIEEKSSNGAKSKYYGEVEVLKAIRDTLVAPADFFRFVMHMGGVEIADIREIFDPLKRYIESKGEKAVIKGVQGQITDTINSYVKSVKSSLPAINFSDWNPTRWFSKKSQNSVIPERLPHTKSKSTSQKPDNSKAVSTNGFQSGLKEVLPDSEQGHVPGNQYITQTNPLFSGNTQQGETAEQTQSLANRLYSSLPSMKSMKSWLGRGMGGDTVVIITDLVRELNTDTSDDEHFRIFVTVILYIIIKGFIERQDKTQSIESWISDPQVKTALIESLRVLSGGWTNTHTVGLMQIVSKIMEDIFSPSHTELSEEDIDAAFGKVEPYTMEFLRV